MKTYTLYQIDSFTRTPFAGNPAGVITNADGLSDDAMQRIARELNNSETAFFLSPPDNTCDGYLRYFTPTTEVPVCGHATIAALYAKAKEANLGGRVLRIKTGVGILPVEVRDDGKDYTVSMTQGKFVLSEPLQKEDTDALLASLHLTADEMDPRCPVQIASTGHSKVMVCLKSAKTLNALEPDNAGLTDLSKRIGCNGYFLFTFDTAREGILTEGRMFAPAIGVAEDPVTGNAHGPLGGYLVRFGLARPGDDGVLRFTGFQGEKIGRPGKVHVEVRVRNGEPETVKIRGEAVIVFKTTLSVPESTDALR